LYSQIAVITLALATSSTATVLIVQKAFKAHVLFADFTVFWTAARFANPYDAAALTRAQLWLLPPDPGLRPFAYPPSALLLIKPFGWLGYSAAVAAWTAIGVACFAAAASLYGRRGLFALAGPMFLLTILIGQASLFLGAALAAGVALVGKRPLIAGAMLGLLGAVKPQLAVLVPLALLCGREWRALAAAAAAGGALAIASLALGPQLWAEWFGSLGAFKQQVLTADFRAMNMAPGMIFAPLGILSAGFVWLRTGRAELRLLAVAAGACLCVPYLGNYDLVAMAPAAGVLLLGRDWRGWVVGLPAFLVLWFSPFVVAIGAAVLAWLEPISPPEPAGSAARRGTGGAFRPGAGRGRPPA
jgi:hypothetical protein